MDRISKPFGGFASFDECVAEMRRRGNVDDPEAVCGALKARLEGKSVGRFSLPLDEVARICPECAKKMKSVSVTAIKFDDVKELPEPLRQALVKATDPGFFRRCMDDPEMCAGADSKEGCCAALHEQLFGMLPSEHERKAAAADDREWIECDVAIAKVDDERRIVVSVVYEPEVADAHEDGMKAEQIERAAHGFMLRYAKFLGDPGVDHAARVTRDQVVVVESFIAPVDFQLNTQLVRKGSWVMGMKIFDDDLWAGVKSGRFRGFSLQGWGRRRAAA